MDYSRKKGYNVKAESLNSSLHNLQLYPIPIYYKKPCYKTYIFALGKEKRNN